MTSGITETRTSAITGETIVIPYDDSNDPPPEPVPSPTGAELLRHLSTVRWLKEEAGTEWNGWMTFTDRGSRTNVLGELTGIQMELRPDPSGYKFMDGEFRELTNTQFAEMAATIAAHVRRCFSAEASTQNAIKSGELTTFEQVDQFFAEEFRNAAD